MIDRACISLNNNCNLRCKYCHFQDKQKDINSFDYNSLIIIIDNIHKYCNDNQIKNFKLGIVGSGEPMLKWNVLLDVLEYIKNSSYNELKLYTITNGTLFTEEILIKFYKYKDIIKICFSLDGYKEIHDYGRMAFEKVMKSIEIYKSIYGLSPSINATVNKLSYENMEKLINFFQRNGLYDVTFSKLVGYFDDDLYITNNQYHEFMEYAFKSGMNSRQFNKEKKYDCTMYGNFCGVGRTNVFITPEGIYPCGRFYKNDKYLLASYNDSLDIVETQVKKMKPVQNGKCYYIENVEER